MTPPVVALVVAYDGGPFNGWQFQPGQPTVQGELERVLRIVHGDPGLAVAGAGRTDTGVHALGQVASFFQSVPRSAEKLLGGLARLLPASIRVLACRTMPPRFHPCRSSLGKIYRYRIIQRSQVLPFEAPWAWHVPYRLDLGAMRRAAGPLAGLHDFSTFTTQGGQSTSPVRHLRRLEIHERGDGVLEIEAEADGFLYRMVRNITGYLVDVGRGRFPAESAGEVLAARDRREAGRTAPAQGLCLFRVLYPPGFDPAEPDEPWRLARILVRGEGGETEASRKG